jgi:hypothetical protein
MDETTEEKHIDLPDAGTRDLLTVAGARLAHRGQLPSED